MTSYKAGQLVFFQKFHRDVWPEEDTGSSTVITAPSLRWHGIGPQ